jgi:hypothetical protein
MRNSTLSLLTSEWLTRHGFPDMPVLHPPSEYDTAEIKKLWKPEYIAALYPKVTGIIDDDTKVINGLNDRLYDGSVYHVDRKTLNWDELATKIIRDML